MLLRFWLAVQNILKIFGVEDALDKGNVLDFESKVVLLGTSTDRATVTVAKQN